MNSTEPDANLPDESSDTLEAATDPMPDPQKPEAGPLAGLSSLSVKKDYTIDVSRLLDNLRDQIEGIASFGPVAFGFNKDSLIQNVNKIKASLPQDVREAANIARESERLLDKAKLDADETKRSTERESEAAIAEARAQVAKMIEDAKSQQKDLISESEVLKLAKAQSDEIRKAAEKEAKDMMREADEYALKMLTTLESSLAKAMNSVERGKSEIENAFEAEKAKARERIKA